LRVALGDFSHRDRRIRRLLDTRGKASARACRLQVSFTPQLADFALELVDLKGAIANLRVADSVQTACRQRADGRNVCPQKRAGWLEVSGGCGEAEQFLIASHRRYTHNEPLSRFSQHGQRRRMNDAICSFDERRSVKLEALFVLSMKMSITVTKSFA
jgi:hypothetical protein